ncbi:hypothetical protein HPB48_008709 [Haemaphysalis longicornis]|uniref:Uncharacterized protein n=1 Tax=Haemaphysalis longicornis TaxID=44386 RepID=A0A9J6H1E6_HAELO|nr:hypothetical protein HPB48_008709 [Haemaphysalis longicornis]
MNGIGLHTSPGVDLLHPGYPAHPPIRLEKYRDDWDSQMIEEVWYSSSGCPKRRMFPSRGSQQQSDPQAKVSAEQRAKGGASTVPPTGDSRWLNTTDGLGVLRCGGVEGGVGDRRKEQRNGFSRFPKSSSPNDKIVCVHTKSRSTLYTVVPGGRPSVKTSNSIHSCTAHFPVSSATTAASSGPARSAPAAA